MYVHVLQPSARSASATPMSTPGSTTRAFPRAPPTRPSASTAACPRSTYGDSSSRRGSARRARPARAARASNSSGAASRQDEAVARALRQVELELDHADGRDPLDAPVDARVGVLRTPRRELALRHDLAVPGLDRELASRGGPAGTAVRPRTRRPRRGCCCRRPRAGCAPRVVSPPPAAQPASRARRAAAPAGRLTAATSSSSRGRQLLAPTPPGQPRRTFPPRATSTTTAGLARRVVEPDALAGDGDGMTEVQLLRVIERRLARRPRRRSRAAPIAPSCSSTASRRRAVDVGAAVAPAGREDEHERAVAPQLAPRAPACRRAARRRTSGAGSAPGGGSRTSTPPAPGRGDLRLRPASRRRRRSRRGRARAEAGARPPHRRQIDGGGARRVALAPSLEAPSRPASCRGRARCTCASPSWTSRPRTSP